MVQQGVDVHSQHRPWDPIALPPHRWLPEGIAVGLVGGAGVALWFLILDFVSRTPFYTPAALGSVLFYGAEGPQEIHRTFGTIWGYTVVHFVAFMALGALFVWMVDKVQNVPSRWLMVLMSFILLDGLFAGTLMMVGQWVISSLGVWAVAVANVVAVVLMAMITWRTRPALRAEFSHRPARTTV
jgi:hypothetical protein